MFDARARKPARLIGTETGELEGESLPAVEIDPETNQPLTDTAAGDTPEVEPILGD